MRQFDKHAEAYDRARGKIVYPERLYELLAERCSARQAALDLGCGNGVSTGRLVPWFAHVEGVDLGENLVAKARVNLPDVPFTVSPAETFASARRFDLVTSATSFYWMDRDLLLRRCADLLTEGGVFCAYRYDFPLIYGGPLRAVVEREVVERWGRYRDERLLAYDDTLERMRASGTFRASERLVVSNILPLSPRDLALVFLSTSFVTRYVEEEGAPGYADDLLARFEAAVPSGVVQTNFDIQAFVAQR